MQINKKILFLVIVALYISIPSRLSPSPNNASSSSLLSHTTQGANIIQGNISALDLFFRSLELLEANNSDVQRVSIIHLGDSHVQAGYYPNAIRRPLQQHFGSAGRGLITPLKISGTNEPPDYLLSSPNSWESSKCAMITPPFSVGIGGIAIKSISPNIEFNISSPGEEFNLIRLFHHSKAPILQPDEDLWTSIECPIYDTDLSTSIALSKSVESVTLRTTKSNDEFNTAVFYGFSLENGEEGVLYHAVGVNGNNYEFTNRSSGIIDQSPLLSPDLIIISLGTNDSYGSFKSAHVYAQICKLITSFKLVNPNTSILLTIPMECYTLSRPSTRSRAKINNNLPLVRDCIIRAAIEFDLPYWDFYTIAGGQGSMNRWHESGLVHPDRIHLTKSGYEIQGDLLYSALKGAYLEYLSNKEPK